MSVFEGFKFRKVSSVVHDLDPRIKFFFVSILFVMAILFTQLISLTILFLIPLEEDPGAQMSPGRGL